MKKTSVKTRIISIVSAVVMLLSVASIGAVSASAAGSTSQGNVYFQPCGNWGEYGAKLMAYFYEKNNASNQAWVDMTKVGDSFVAAAPAGCDTVLFARVPGNFVPYQTETWNQTYDLKIELGKTYKATGYEGKFYTGAWNGAGTTPAAPEQEKKVNSVSFVPSTEWKSANAHFMAYFYQKGGNRNAWVPMYVGARNTNMTAAIPAGNFTHVIFVRFEQGKGYDFSQAWNKTVDINLNKIKNGGYTANGWELDPNADGTNSNWF